MIRVFPRRTKWTPDDELAFVGDPPLFRPTTTKQTEVRISVTFTWDVHEGQRLQKAWSYFYSHVYLGGPAIDRKPPTDFIPGRFLKQGVTITSRGCPRKCPWCAVPQREGKIFELPIQDGWIVQDNNLLACSEKHIEAVFKMLRRQKKGVCFKGGLDTRLLKSWHIELLKSIKVREIWVACDSRDSMDHLEMAADLLYDFPTWKKRCFVMIGYGDETLHEAEMRLDYVYRLGFLPFSQLYIPKNMHFAKSKWPLDWRKLNREWSRPAAYRTVATERGRG
jgi:hypothetical protein